MPKFRAWDKQFKIIGEVTEIRFSKVQETLVKYRIEHTNGKKEDVCSHIDDNGFGTCVLMQATGLKDKNGVEIYEGDILKNRRYSGIRVLFEKGAFKVRYERSKVYIVTQDLSSLLEKYKSTIIIGNIYENPELLEVGE